MKKERNYLVVGGTPHTNHNGHTTFTSLKVVGVFETLREANGCVGNEYDNYGGLIEVFEVGSAPGLIEVLKPKTW